MSWRAVLIKSPTAMKPEGALKPKVIEHRGGYLQSTANTDLNQHIINLDVSQSPLKCALSYAYELKNLDNEKKYNALVFKAKQQLINKPRFVKMIFELEAEAIYFRCQIFHELELDASEFLYRKEYLAYYESNPKSIAIKKMASFSQENGVIRRQYAAKKYYSDCYDHYTGKQVWPSFYDLPRSKTSLAINNGELKITWRDFIYQSSSAVELEYNLQPIIIENSEGKLASTAQTDINMQTITLDTLQMPVKSALSFAYELKNFENVQQYQSLIQQAKKQLITKAHFLKAIFQLQAEAVYFRCQIIRELNLNQSDLLCRPEYLDFYDRDSKTTAVRNIALFIQDNGIIKRQYAAKQYYVDSYDFYAGKKNWPSFYSAERSALILTGTRDMIPKSYDPKKIK